MDNCFSLLKDCQHAQVQDEIHNAHVKRGLNSRELSEELHLYLKTAKPNWAKQLTLLLYFALFPCG